MDNAVLEAIADVPIDRDTYPNIYRWKHSVQLYKTMDRYRYLSKIPIPRIILVIKIILKKFILQMAKS